jgi:HlyD family secretion protein
MSFFLRRPWTLIVALVVLVGGAGLFANAHVGATRKAKTDALAAASLAQTPYAGIASGKADVEGGVIQVAARTAGVIRSVDVKEGDYVHKGQVLAQLEDEQPRINLATAQAAVSQAQAQIGLLEVQESTARREYDRLQPLRARNFVAGQAVDTAQDAIRTAQAQLGVQRAAIRSSQALLAASAYQLELTRVRAPADGRIVRRYANPGAGASTLNVSTLFDLEPKAPRIVRAEISEADLPRISPGQEVQIVPESDATRAFPGTVLRRSDEFGARKLQSDDPNEKTDDRVVEVVVSADGAPLLIGQRVLVKFLKLGAHAPPAAGSPAAPPSKPA